jgi:hypothetical protein
MKPCHGMPFHVAGVSYWVKPCHGMSFNLSGVPYWVKPCHGMTFHDKVSLSKEHQTQRQVEWNDIWPQTTQFYNERISTDPILVTWQSTVYEPPEDGFKKRDRNM